MTGATEGLIWAILALGVYLSYRILDFADLTCEGSITLGASVTAMLIWKGVNPFIALLVSFLAGCIAGIVTGVLHTKFKLPPILSGILTMCALYSVNIHIMSLGSGNADTSNLSLANFRKDIIYAHISDWLGLNRDYTTLLVGVVVCLILIALLYWFFGTELGAAIRATGANEKMCRAQGINTDLTKIIGLALGNGLVALAGFFYSQYNYYSDVKIGIGSIVIGLASIIIGEAIFVRFKNFFLTLTGIVVGAVIYRMVIAFVFHLGLPSTNMKMITAAIVVVALMIPKLVGYIKSKTDQGKKDTPKDAPAKPQEEQSESAPAESEPVKEEVAAND